MHIRRRFHRSHHSNDSPLFPSLLPLSMVEAGQTVELVRIGECRRLRKRLADLGLNTGLSVRVVQNSFVGPLILAVREDSRLAIGRGMAQHILVRPLNSTNGHEE